MIDLKDNSVRRSLLKPCSLNFLKSRYIIYFAFNFVKVVLSTDRTSLWKSRKLGNYRPVSELNGISKIYERYIHNSLSSYAKTILSSFISAYKKSYSSSHVLLRLIENWKKSRDNKNFVGTILMDLYKAFDCILHDLLAAKLHAYGLL